MFRFLSFLRLYLCIYCYITQLLLEMPEVMLKVMM